MAETAAQKKAAALDLLKKAESAVAKTQARVTQNDAALNAAEKAATASRRAVIDTAPAPIVKSNTPKLDAVKATNAARVAADAKLKEDLKPKNPAPPGTYYQWHVFAGGGGEYRLINIPGYVAPGARGGGGGGNGGAGGGGGGGGDVIPTKITDPAGPSTNISVLKSLLSSLGYSKTLVDSSTQYFMSLINEGLDYDNIVSLYTDAKDYTLKSGQKITSPFYEQYGYLNEGLTQTKTASELFNFVEGARNLVKSYNVSSKFADPESLKKYVQNNVTVEKLDERMMSAKLRTISADPQYVNTLRKLNYINTSEDLTDFFLDPKIGEAQLETNRKTAVFATEALRRSNLNTGITFDGKSLSSSAANLIAQGRSEAQIADIASQGYETIGQILQPSVGLSNIFEGQQAATAQTIQQELEAEQFMGTESKRRKKLTELGTRVFQAQTGRQTRNDSIYGQV